MILKRGKRYTLKIKVIGESIINNWPVKILSLAIAVLLFYFYRLTTTDVHYISVPLEIMVSDSFIIAETYPTDVRVSLRGSSENIFLINERDITAYVDFSAKEESGEYREPIRIRRRGNALYADPLEIRVRPTEIRLKIEEKLVKNVPVIPVIRGASARNYEVISSSIMPDNITIEGPLSIVERISLVRTEDINIENRRENFILSVRLERINDLVKFVESDEVQFSGRIERNLVSKNIDLFGIEIRGRKDDFIYELEFDPYEQRGSITLDAERGIIGFFNNENCFLYVDLSDLDTPGVYNQPVSASLFDIEGEVFVVDITPATIEVHITSREG